MEKPSFDIQVAAIIAAFSWDEYVALRRQHGYDDDEEKGRQSAARLFDHLTKNRDPDSSYCESGSLRASTEDGWCKLELVTHCDLDARDIFGWPDEDDGITYRKAEP